MAHLLAVDRSRAGERIAMAAIMCCALHVLNPALAADKLKRLNAAEIRAIDIGNVITDGGHWSDRFEAGGTLIAVDLGVLKPGTWRLEGNEMCVVRKTRKPVKECFEIWISSDEVEYRRDGITLTTGVLRRE